MMKSRPASRRKIRAAELIAPSHLGLIPDGNRRWSKANSFSFASGYRNGIKKFISFSLWAKGFGIKTISVWALSTENIKMRSGAETRALYFLFSRAAKDKKLIDLLIKNNARLRVIGDLSLIPSNVRKAIHALEAKTVECRDFTINLLIGYGGREDILYALRGAQKGGSKIDEEEFQNRIMSASLPDLDLIIRTSGEHRLSGFLPWQASYSEIYFAKKYWPDFEKKDLKRAIEAFSQRDRRFGK